MSAVAETRDRLAKRFPDCHITVWHTESYREDLGKYHDYRVMVIQDGVSLGNRWGRDLALVASQAAQDAITATEDTKAAAIRNAIALLQAEGYEV